MNLRKQNRCKDAIVRQEARGKRTPQQQIAELDARLGKGVGAVKERKRITAASK